MAVCQCCGQDVKRAGLVALDAEFRTATTARGSVGLTRGETFQLLALLADGAPRAKYQDFLMDALRLQHKNALHRMILRMRRRIAPLGLVIETLDGPAYRLSAAASADNHRRIAVFDGRPNQRLLVPEFSAGSVGTRDDQLDLVEFIAKRAQKEKAA